MNELVESGEQEKESSQIAPVIRVHGLVGTKEFCLGRSDQ